ncbi:hypothetical protein LCGC14_1169860 [marine sediment metagenome]|uniref:Uncharacterized protein n=1 Tax=marine sediment metagenome TaxID=412755 RepID=A0A0F9PVQ3_9ZZZZ
MAENDEKKRNVIIRIDTEGNEIICGVYYKNKDNRQILLDWFGGLSIEAALIEATKTIVRDYYLEAEAELDTVVRMVGTLFDAFNALNPPDDMEHIAEIRSLVKEYLKMMDYDERVEFHKESKREGDEGRNTG